MTAGHQLGIGVVGAGRWAALAHLPGWARRRGGQARAQREAGRARPPRRQAGRRTGRAKGLKTKVGFTFRYSPAVRYLKDLLTQGDLGIPYIYNAYEQNSQWLDPRSPLRSAAPSSAERTGSGPIQVASLEGYGAPVIDIGHWFMESDLTAVVGIGVRVYGSGGAAIARLVEEEVINAVISHHERRWVSLPLDGPGDGAGDGAGDGEAAR